MGSTLPGEKPKSRRFALSKTLGIAHDLIVGLEIGERMFAEKANIRLIIVRPIKP
jgi:hypothetical protein